MGHGAGEVAIGKLKAAARDLYTPPPEADASLGLVPEDFPPVVVEVWPENWPSIELFCAMSTQWMPCATGVIGLRYEALADVRQALGVSDADWPRRFQDLRVMESAALEVLRSSNG